MFFTQTARLQNLGLKQGGRGQLGVRAPAMGATPDRKGTGHVSTSTTEYVLHRTRRLLSARMMCRLLDQYVSAQMYLYPALSSFDLTVV